MHGGDPLIEGTRYIIAAFLLLEEGRDGDGDDYDQTNDGKGDEEKAVGHQQQPPKQEGTPQHQSQSQQQQQKPQQQQQQQVADDDDTLLLGRILQTHTSLSHLRPTRGKDRGRVEVGVFILSYVYYLAYLTLPRYTHIVILLIPPSPPPPSHFHLSFSPLLCLLRQQW